jgi:DNA-damage-inducible protein D
MFPRLVYHNYIKQLFELFESACYNYDGIECWSARELQTILGYSKWVNFKNVVDKAQKSCKQAGEVVKNHFAEIGKMVEIGSGVEKEIPDIALTRYACYLVAQNGDATTKPEIAFAQTYFAVQTRKQEIIEQRLLDVARVTAREKLSKSEKKLSAIIYERGVEEKGFAMIRQSKTARSNY